MKTKIKLILNEKDITSAIRNYVAYKLDDNKYTDSNIVPDSAIEFKKNYSYEPNIITITVDTDDKIETNGDEDKTDNENKETVLDYSQLNVKSITDISST